MTDSNRPLAELSPAGRHRIVAADFARELAALPDLGRQTPVPEWTAADVVGHLVEWFPSFLAVGGIDFTPPISVETDPLAAWDQQSAAIQELFESDRATADFSHPYVGTATVADAVDTFYNSDVFMHTWDLAQSGGRRPDLDERYAAAILERLRSVEEALRRSGQCGAPYPSPDPADPVRTLAAFIGRDPAFTPSPDSR